MTDLSGPTLPLERADAIEKVQAPVTDEHVLKQSLSSVPADHGTTTAADAENAESPPTSTPAGSEVAAPDSDSNHAGAWQHRRGAKEAAHPALPTEVARLAAPHREPAPLRSTNRTPHSGPTASPAAPRGANLAAAATRAGDHDRRGFDLANRGAYYAARAEFRAALRAVAEGLDADYATTAHTQALAAGFRALDEAEDFLPRGSRAIREIVPLEMARSHQTPVLHDTHQSGVTPAMARQYYLTYASQQLSAAVAGEPAAAQALYCLGKLHGIFAGQQPDHREALEQRAMTFYSAALVAAPSHYMAANDLGVLMAQRGRYQEAHGLLSQSLSISPQAATWHNLAMVQTHLGQNAAAESARKASLTLNGGAALPNPALAAMQSVRWVAPSTFAQTALPASDLQKPTALAQVPTGSKTTNQPATPAESPAPRRLFAPLREARQHTTTWQN